MTGIESLVGSLNNILPARIHVAPQTALVAWLQELQVQQAELRHYEHSPMIKIHECSGVPRDQLLYDSYLVFENYPIEAGVGERSMRWNLQPLDALVQTEHPIRAQVWPLQALRLEIYSHRRYFDPATIARILERWQATLEQMVAHPYQPLRGFLAGEVA